MVLRQSCFPCRTPVQQILALFLQQIDTLILKTKMHYPFAALFALATAGVVSAIPTTDATVPADIINALGVGLVKDINAFITVWYPMFESLTVALTSCMVAGLTHQQRDIVSLQFHNWFYQLLT